jgi:hypothetical protein
MGRVLGVRVGATALLLAACSPSAVPPSPSAPALSPQRPAGPAAPTVRPYTVPVYAASNELLGWSEQDVLACFGPSVAQDQIGGLPRHMFRRDACTEWIMFRDGQVHSVEGYGAEQECWWVVDACAD